jgi:hypothetical protein
MAKKPEETSSKVGFALAKENYIYLVIGFVIIIIGFLLMMGGKSPDPAQFNAKELFSFRRITLAPIVVMLGFAFEIWAIMKKPRATGKE